MIEYRGRFAPSPTGPLHFGSLVTAVASYLEAKQRHGKWLIRIEDLDTPRIVTGATASILHTLETFGFEWDEEICYQSQRTKLYEEALHQLIKEDFAYPCRCTRKQLQQQDALQRYPGTCRLQTIEQAEQVSYRLLTQPVSISFTDRLQGEQQQQIENEVGDFIIKRRDGLFAYQLAVVIDDEEQKITDIVRGSDLLEVTARQIYLQQLLHFPTPSYLHLPIATNQQGEKLSKQTYAEAISPTRSIAQLFAALQFLGQRPDNQLVDATINDFWDWAIINWDRKKIPELRAIQAEQSVFLDKTVPATYIID